MSIAFEITPGVGSMNIPVNFYRQLQWAAEKIRDIQSKRILTIEFPIIQLTVAQRIP